MTRKEAIEYGIRWKDAIIDRGDTELSDAIQFLNMAIQALNQESKTGHWIGIDDYPHEDWECNNCGYVIETVKNPNDFIRYCPNCGARMESDEE